MPSSKMTLKQQLLLERELARRAIEAGLVARTIKPPPPKLTAAQASVAARKERTLASLGPKVARAIRHQKRDAEWEKERSELQAKREQLESQVSPVPTQRTARKRVAWADSEKRVHTFVGYKKLLQEINRRYEVDEEYIHIRYEVDEAGGWRSSSPYEGVNRVRAPGWMSVNGYQSMPDDWKDAEDVIDETF
ncbi:MAG: hypothetical protein Q9192_006292 [Flavoplaca navasiana]